MKIGLTYDLREEHPAEAGAPPDHDLEFSSASEIDQLAGVLAKLGHGVCRIGHLPALVHFLADGGQVDIVFNYAAGVIGRGREAQIPALLDAYGIPYTFSDSLTLAVCLDKGLTKLVWQKHGLATAPFSTVSDLGALENGSEHLPPYPLFVKPMYEGSSKGITSASVVETAAQLQERVAYVLRTYRQPALVETFLPGREFTVGVMGDGGQARVIGLVEIRSTSPGGVNSYTDKEEWDRRIPNYFRPVDDAALREAVSALALAAYRAVECLDIGRVDVRCDSAGRPHLLEINPLPGLHPVHSALSIIGRNAGIPYEALLAEVLQHACRRWGLRC